MLAKVNQPESMWMEAKTRKPCKTPQRTTISNILWEKAKQKRRGRIKSDSMACSKETTLGAKRGKC